MEVVDPLHVRFILKQPWPAFFTTARYALTYILPKAYFEKVGSKGFQDKPIGTGPFSFDSMKAGEWVKVAANTHYWRTPPKIKTVTLRLVGRTVHALRNDGARRGRYRVWSDWRPTGKGQGQHETPDRRVSYSGTSGILFNKKLFPGSR